MTAAASEHLKSSMVFRESVATEVTAHPAVSQSLMISVVDHSCTLSLGLRFTAVTNRIDVIVFSQLSPSAVLICGTVADAQGSSFSDQVADRHRCLGQLLSGPCSAKGTPPPAVLPEGVLYWVVSNQTVAYICFTCSRVHRRHLFDLVPYLAYMHPN